MPLCCSFVHVNCMCPCFYAEVFSITQDVAHWKLLNAAFAVAPATAQQHNRPFMLLLQSACSLYAMMSLVHRLYFFMAGTCSVLQHGKELTTWQGASLYHVLHTPHFGCRSALSMHLTKHINVVKWRDVPARRQDSHGPFQQQRTMHHM